MLILKAIAHKDRLPLPGNFGMGDFWTGGREYNMTGWHVSPLHHGAIPVSRIFGNRKAAIDYPFS